MSWFTNDIVWTLLRMVCSVWLVVPAREKTKNAPNLSKQKHLEMLEEVGIRPT